MSEASLAGRDPGHRVCTRCVLPETFPGADLDEAGVCRLCRERSAPETAARDAYRKRFEELMDSRKGRETSHDVILAFSGGKDSTYTLDVFRSLWSLRVLAVTVDNGFISPAALDNMRLLTDRLGADHMIVRPNPVLMRRLFRASLERDLYPAKTLQRASSICTSCISVVKGVVLRTAIEKSIPFVGWGWSPGQAPVQSSVMRVTPEFARMSQRALLGPILKAAGPGLSSWFLDESHFNTPGRFPWNIHPLAFLDYSEGDILERIRSLGWRKPRDTDPNSTNCLLNALGNRLHLERHGFHPYALEIAGIVRQGDMTREEGLDKLQTGNDEEAVRLVLDILNSDRRERP